MAKLSPEALLAELQEFSQNVPPELETNPVLRSKISQAARQVQLSLEKPADTVARLYLSQVNLAYPRFVLGGSLQFSN